MGLGSLTTRFGHAAAPATLVPLLLALAPPAPAAAELPEPVRAMIEAAMATGDAAKVAAVVEAARTVSPAESSAIDALHDEFRQQQAARAAERREAEQEQIRHAGLFDRWSGRGQIGAFQSTGNSESVGVTASLNLERAGIAWQHRLRASLDYRETAGIPTREQYFVSYEPRFEVSPRLFVYALGQWDKDEFQGFASRVAVSGGLGYQVLSRRNAQLSIKLGPAWRRTLLTDGTVERRLAALAGLDLDWQLTEAIKLTQDTDLVAEGGGTATAFIDANNTTLNLVTGLEADIIASLTARLSYAIEYDSNPAKAAKTTDTLTRFTLVYDF
jgi:putative salt-induced outer membrane protein